MMANHSIVHVEIASKDPKASTKFYSEVFGWKTEVAEQFNYYQFIPDGGPGGAFVTPGEGVEGPEKNGVLIYIGTDDVDSSLAQVEAHGGKVLTPKTEIPGTGWFGVFSDPSGTKVAVFQGTNP
jgi:predicted enzyme related to lactoylglutathione lyase